MVLGWTKNGDDDTYVWYGWRAGWSCVCFIWNGWRVGFLFSLDVCVGMVCGRVGIMFDFGMVKTVMVLPIL